MRFLGKQFFNNHAYGSQTTNIDKDGKVIYQSNMGMNPDTMREVLTQVSRRKASTSRKSSQRKSQDQKRLSIDQNKKSGRSSLGRSTIKPSINLYSSKLDDNSPEKEYNFAERQKSQQPPDRVSSIPKKIRVSRIGSEERKVGVGSFLEREKLKLIGGSNQKMSHEILERIEKEKLRGTFNSNLNNHNAQASQSEQRKLHPNSTSAMDLARNLKAPSSGINSFLTPFGGKPQPHIRSRSPIASAFNSMADNHPVKPNFKTSIGDSILTTNHQQLLAKSSGNINNPHGLSNNHLSGNKSIENSHNKRGMSSDKRKSKILTIDSQVKRNDQLMSMLNKTKKL